MGLSKDNIDVLEEVKTLQLTTAQKRRIRRKKLRAVRAGSLETDSNTRKDLNTPQSKSLTDFQKHTLNKKQKNTCDPQVLNKTQKSMFKETNLVCNPKLKCEKAILSNDIKPIAQDTVSNKNCKSIHKDTKTDVLKSDVHSLLTNQNKLPKLENHFAISEEKPTCENLVLNKKRKSKLNGNHEIKLENPCPFKAKKDKSDKSLSIENHTAAKLNLVEKQSVASHILLSNENQSTDLNKLSNKQIIITSEKDHDVIKEPIIESFNSETYSTKSEIFGLESQDPKQQTTQSVENIESNFEKQRMGKVQDIPQSKKPEEGQTRTDSTKKETASADASAKSRDDIKAAREAKKLAKQKAKKKDVVGDGVEVKIVSPKINLQTTLVKKNVVKNNEVATNQSEKTKTIDPMCDLKSKENNLSLEKKKVEDKGHKDLADKSEEDIKNGATAEQPEEASKSKAELRAERRTKQEAQRAAKQELQREVKQTGEHKPTAPETKAKEPPKSKEEKSIKVKSAEKPKFKTQSTQKVGWFQHLFVEKDKESLNNIPINSNLHPAVVKLGVQLATRVVTGSNARCIALLDAIKKMVRDYSLPARTEVGRGLQAQLAAAADFLWARRAPAAAETNALKHFRRQLTHLPANVDEFDAKKQLQEEIERYIREQIDMAGEAISLTLRNKISPGDNILTYGCSSLIERVLCSAWEAGVRFRATVAGARGQRGPEMLRRLRARGVPASYVDISALSYVMNDVQKVVLGAGALLAHGAALGAAGSAQVALVARARNVPVLVACETHKFSERTHVDPLACHEIGDPDELIDKTDENSPLKDWRSNPNLTLLNVTYDVTPPSLITAVVTELGILPCTSAPVVLRFKQSEYGM